MQHLIDGLSDPGDFAVCEFPTKDGKCGKEAKAYEDECYDDESDEKEEITYYCPDHCADYLPCSNHHEQYLARKEETAKKVLGKAYRPAIDVDPLDFSSVSRFFMQTEALNNIQRNIRSHKGL